MPAKRKRKRTRVNPGPVLVLALIIALVSGLMASPLTSLSKVSVIGAKPVDRAVIDSTLATLNKIPWVMVNPRWVETRIQRIEAVDHANYSQNLFGRGRLEITYRVPVAKVKGKQIVAMDATGAMFVTDTVSDDLPVVIRPDSMKAVPLTIAGALPLGSVADLAVKAKQLDPASKLIIWFDKHGALCLNIGKGMVVLGSSEDLDAKLHALREILDQEPDVLSTVVSLNLTEPSHPAKAYKRQRS